MKGIIRMLNVFIIGSKGIPANYGGFETFVDKLVSNKKCNDIKYHVSCLSDNNREFEYNNARCFNVNVKNIGSAKAIIYDVKSLKRCIQYIEQNKIKDAVIYILACRIGPFIKYYKRKLSKLGVKLYVNPDGHEWKRSKWNYFIREYWKKSEELMVKHSDLLICDSRGIEEYIKNDYYKYHPKTRFIAYGADIEKSKLDDNSNSLVEWYQNNDIKKYEYYLIVGRFVPENNYETVIREFMNSCTNKKLVIISNVEENKFYKQLLNNTGFNKDKRIKFVGTVYDQELLKKIRENAYAYIHGHEVGGTNPSLLEALSSTKINLLVDVNFNREVGKDSALYFEKSEGNLMKLIQYVDNIKNTEIDILAKKSTNRIKKYYTWNKIVDEYEELFLECFKNLNEYEVI